MTKYLFLLGFFAFSFLSTPAANAVEVTVYQGIVYDGEDLKILACDKRGRNLLHNMRVNEEMVDEQSIPAGCRGGEISKFILFEENKEYATDNHKYVESFVYYSQQGEWVGGKHIEVRSAVVIEECSKEKVPENLLDDCTKNVEQFEDLKEITTNGYERSPDSIK